MKKQPELFKQMKNLLVKTSMKNRKPSVNEVLPLMRRYYAIPGNEGGGSLHIVLDDGNIEDSDIKFCQQLAEDANDLEGITLALILLQMSKWQRNELFMKRKRSLK